MCRKARIIAIGNIISVSGIICRRQTSFEKKPNLSGRQIRLFRGADDGARTRYLHLGKVALYQMSYIRINMVPPVGIEPTTRGFSVHCSTN